MNLRIIQGDCRETLAQLEPGTVQCCVTSPPYWGLRSYLPKDHPDKHREIGQEKTPADFVASLLAVFGGKENPVGVWRALREDGTLWLNLGDSYASAWSVSSEDGLAIGAGSLKDGKRGARPNRLVGGLKEKDLVGIPWRVAFALQAAGWYLRNDIIWAKPNCMPESVTDRCTRSHEYIFLLTKSPRYYYDADAIKEPAKQSSVERLGQDVENQNGTDWPGKTNGAMKAVKFGGNKQCDDSRLHSGNDWKPKGRGGKNAFRGQGHERDGNGPANRAGRDMKDVGTEIWANKRDVWTVAPACYAEAHFATFPPELITPCILAGSKAGDLVLDPFGGSGTTAQVALELGRHAVTCELNDGYIPLIEQRTNITPGLQLA